MGKKNLSLIGLASIMIFVLTAGFGCKAPSREVQEKMKPLELNFWGVFDDQDAFNEIITAYQTAHPNIRINYKKFRYEEYEQQILEALAEDRGPDIFFINQSWLKKYQSKLLPLPAKITLAYQVVSGGLQKEVTYELRTKNTPTAREIKANYPDVVYKNVALDDQIYGLPLSLETLVMFYNKDILNQSDVATAPTDWKTFMEDVVKTTRFDSKDKIVQSGAALGTGYNINRSFDILSVLMMQNGATMTAANGSATFLNAKSGYNPGLTAIQFYSDFASPIKNVYSWNSQLDNSLTAFAAGKVAFTFGYNYDLPTIRSQAPKLNFGLAPLPQVNPGAPVNYGSYWIGVVSQKSQQSDEAWDFLVFLTEKEQAQKYLTATKRPAALKALIAEQRDDEDLYAASTQTLTADNWYRGQDPQAAEQAVKDMLEQLPNITDEKQFENTLNTAVNKINQTIK